jgi:hypothetical protein
MLNLHDDKAREADSMLLLEKWVNAKKELDQKFEQYQVDSADWDRKYRRMEIGKRVCIGLLIASYIYGIVYQFITAN